MSEKKFVGKYKPRCYVCDCVLKELIKMKEYVGTPLERGEEHLKQMKKVARTITTIIHHGEKLHRCSERCEPGSPRYMKHPVLGKQYRERHMIRKEGG
jgi:hypothetical protein